MSKLAHMQAAEYVYSSWDGESVFPHLCEILQTAPRTFYKHAGGNADGRTTNGKTVTDSRISVDMFFYNLYHTAAEYLPEHEFQLNDVDSQIEAEQSGKSDAAVQQCSRQRAFCHCLGRILKNKC